MPHPDFGFSRERRLKKSGDIIAVFKGGKRRETPYFSFLWKKNSLGYDRLAVVVNKKFGNSVERNRGKRLMREAFRLERMDKGIDIVIYLKAPLKKVSFSKVRKALRDCMEKV